MRHATSNLTSGCRAFDLAFDEAKLMEEMHFFVTHFVEGLCKTKPSAAASSILEEFFLSICRTLSAEPRIFTHRDFHSRNLILHGNRLVMLDFQDARMGPAQYDLASLLPRFLRYPAGGTGRGTPDRLFGRDRRNKGQFSYQVPPHIRCDVASAKHQSAGHLRLSVVCSTAAADTRRRFPVRLRTCHTISASIRSLPDLDPRLRI